MDLFPTGSISGSRLLVDDYAFPLPYRTLSLVKDGQQVTMGVRREAVIVTRQADSPNGISLPAAVEAFETDLVHRQQIVFLREGSFAFSGLCSADVKLYVGLRVTAQLDPERLYFFDTKTGKRL